MFEPVSMVLESSSFFMFRSSIIYIVAACVFV